MAQALNGPQGFGNPFQGPYPPTAPGALPNPTGQSVNFAPAPIDTNRATSLEQANRDYAVQLLSTSHTEELQTLEKKQEAEITRLATRLAKLATNEAELLTATKLAAKDTKTGLLDIEWFSSNLPTPANVLTLLALIGPADIGIRVVMKALYALLAYLGLKASLGS